ncbi:MAG: two-component regulator propeller domain-containing protein [Undibacterium sp.]|nr:two-component regulator propeller domain-containing protein [Undibacterium sp.]
MNILLKNVVKHIGALLFLLACSLVSAAPTSELRFQHLATFGANQLSTLSLIQDRQGFIWIGTNNAGLYRYDGYRAEKFQHSPMNGRSLPHDRVSALFEDKEGRIWAGTQNGLARFNAESGDFTRFLPVAGSNSQHIIKAIISDGKSGMWLATWGGLQHFDPALGTFTIYSHDPARPTSLGTNDLNAIALDDQGGVWAGTWPAGIDYLAPGASEFRHYRVDTEQAPDPKLNIVRSLHIDAQHILWMGTENGVVQWKAGSDWSERRRIDSPVSRVTSIYPDRNGTIWVATLSAGLLRWDKGASKFMHFVNRATDPYSLPSDDIRAVLHDRGGMLWAASFTDGIALTNLNSKGFVRTIPYDVDRDNPRPNNALQRITGAPGGRLWLSGNTGVTLFDPVSNTIIKQFRADPTRSGALSNNIAYSLYQQPGGPLWVGTSVGLNRLDATDGPFKVSHFGNAANDYINTIAPGDAGILWLGTGDSLIRYDSHLDTYTAYTPNPSDPSSRNVKGTTTILQDKSGRLWAGAEWVGGGLDLLDVSKGTFRHFRHDAADPASLSNDNVSSLHQDASGRLWVGTHNGLNEIITAKDGSISIRGYAGKDSVGTAKIVAIESDLSGKLWLSTVAGLIRFDPERGTVERYSVSDGLSDSFAGASYRGGDGVLYFGGIKGMTAVYPDAVRSNSIAPQIAITDISVFNRSLKDGQLPSDVTLVGPVTAPKSLRILRQESVFSLEFAALHFTDPAQNRYAYRLQGFDRDWVEVDADHRNATYTNLNPGDYVFQVKAANDRGVWSEQAATLTISIPPPYWQTAWFRALIVLLVAGMLVSAYRWRVASLTRHQARLESLVAVRLQELLAQQQLNRDTAERMQAILQNAADVILTADKDWKIESCNRAGLALFGWSMQQMAGMPFAVLCAGDDAQKLQQALVDTTFAKKGQIDLEIQQVRADGSEFSAELSLSAFPDAGQRKFIVIVRDVTEQKRVERMKSQFVSTVSHELRTPLTAIRGGLGLMVGGVTGVLPPPAAKLGQIALNNAERLARLIDDLLDMQKIEANMMDFNFQTLPLPALIADAIESHLSFAQRLGVAIALDGDAPNLVLRVDPDRFAQIMANLMSNACKYSPKGETVKIRIARLESQRLRIEVADRGPGIPVNFGERIFQKFSQADASDTRSKDGTGLGLAIAKEMIEKMNGSIGFHANPGGGTVFYIELPIIPS